MELIHGGLTTPAVALPDEITSQIDRAFTLDVLEVLVAAILAGYGQRKAVVAQYGHPGIGGQAWPHVRRAAWQTNLLALPKRSPDLGIQTEVHRASRGNDHFVELSINGLRLVACGVNQRHRLPRRALSRQTRAHSGQQSLLQMEDGKLDLMGVDLAAPIFGLLLHAPSRQDPERLSFLDLEIPDGNYRRSITSRDLLMMAADLRKVVENPVQTRNLRLKAPARSEEAQ